MSCVASLNLSLCKKGQEIPFLNLTVTDWVSLTLLAWLGPCWLLEPVYSPLSLYSSFTFQLCSYKSTLALFRVFRSRNTCSPSNKTNKSKTWLCACYVCCSARDLKMNHVDNPLRFYIYKQRCDSQWLKMNWITFAHVCTSYLSTLHCTHRKIGKPFFNFISSSSQTTAKIHKGNPFSFFFPTTHSTLLLFF